MRFGRLGTELAHGYNAMTTRESDMMMDIGYQVMDKSEHVSFEDRFQETAFVILTGKVEIEWGGATRVMERHSLFDERSKLCTGLLSPRGYPVRHLRSRSLERQRRAYRTHDFRL